MAKMKVRGKTDSVTITCDCGHKEVFGCWYSTQVPGWDPRQWPYIHKAINNFLDARNAVPVDDIIDHVEEVQDREDDPEMVCIMESPSKPKLIREDILALLGRTGPIYYKDMKNILSEEFSFKDSNLRALLATMQGAAIKDGNLWGLG